MVRLKELWAHMYNSVSTPAISLRNSSHWTRQTREPTGSLGALAKSFLKVWYRPLHITETFGLFHAFVFATRHRATQQHKNNNA